MPLPGQRVRGWHVQTPASLWCVTAVLWPWECTEGEGRTHSLDTRKRGKLMQMT